MEGRKIAEAVAKEHGLPRGRAGVEIGGGLRSDLHQMHSALYTVCHECLSVSVSPLKVAYIFHIFFK